MRRRGLAVIIVKLVQIVENRSLFLLSAELSPIITVNISVIVRGDYREKGKGPDGRKKC
jgi:hypothetical protein